MVKTTVYFLQCSVSVVVLFLGVVVLYSVSVRNSSVSVRSSSVSVRSSSASSSVSVKSSSVRRRRSAISSNDGVWWTGGGTASNIECHLSKRCTIATYARGKSALNK